MKLFCITLFVLVHISFAARLQAADKPEALVFAERANVYRDRTLVYNPIPVITPTLDALEEELFETDPSITFDPSVSLDPDQPTLAPSLPPVDPDTTDPDTSATTRDAPEEELFETDPSITFDPSVSLDPDQPNPDINDFVTPTPVPARKGLTFAPRVPPTITSGLPPTTLGGILGFSGKETDAFRQKCFTCSNVTKDILKPWKNSPTHACNVCRLNKDLAPKKSGKCMEGMYLGRYDAPTDCFFERCHQMLLDRTNSCMCFWDNRSSRSGGAALAR